VKCTHCGSTENLHVNSKSKDGTRKYYICNPCNNKRCNDYYHRTHVKKKLLTEEEKIENWKKYLASPQGKIASKKATKKYQLANPLRMKAWNLAKKIPARPCVICGKYPGQRHHPDISKPMEVIFLCPYHHKQADLQLKSKVV